MGSAGAPPGSSDLHDGRNGHDHHDDNRIGARDGSDDGGRHGPGDAVSGPASGVPASGIPAHGTRPPFAPGNTLALHSGHRTPRVYGSLAEHLVAGLAEDRPDLTRYPEALAAWATAEAQTALLRRHLEEVGLMDEEGQPRKGLLDWLVRLENLAARQRSTLGLDPRSDAQLARERAEAATLAVDLDALAERGRAAMARREPVPDVAGEVLGAVLAEGERATHAGVVAWALQEASDTDLSLGSERR